MSTRARILCGLLALALGMAALFVVSVDQNGWHAAIMGWLMAVGLTLFGVGVVLVVFAVSP